MNAPVRKAILLAAGRGTRLGGLTADRPKPMIPVAGRPALWHILDGLRDAGIRDVCLVVGYRADAIRAPLGDGSAVGLRIAYVHQEVAQGTGAALRLGREFAAGDPVLAAYGDVLTDPHHYRGLAEAYAAAAPAAVIGINLLPDPAAGAAVYRQGDRVTRIVEKPAPGSAVGCWNASGLSVYGPEVWPILDALKPSVRGEYELTDAIAALVAGDKCVLAHELHGYCLDIGVPERLAEAEALLAGEEVR